MQRPPHTATVTFAPVDTVQAEVDQIAQDEARAKALSERHWDAGVALMGGLTTATVAALYFTERRTEAATLSLVGGILGTVYTVSRILGRDLGV